MKDEMDLMADIEWFSIQESFFEAKAKCTQKEIELFQKYRKIREYELKNVREKKKTIEKKH